MSTHWSVLRQFFSLLRAGLGIEPADCRLFLCQKEVDWPSIFRLSEEQTVVAVVWDGMLTLPKELHPKKDLFYQWLVKVLAVEKSNERMNIVLPEVLERLAALHLPVVLLKGQGTGALYPNPLHRQCGDIDIYPGRRGYDILQRALPGLGFLPKNNSTKHAEHVYKGILVENHRYVALFFSPVHARRLEQLVEEWYPQGLSSRLVSGNAVNLPPSWFEGLFAVIHFAFHLHLEGVGLRHLCDWHLIMQQQLMDRKRYESGLRRLGLCRMEKIMRELCDRLLGKEENAWEQGEYCGSSSFVFSPLARKVFDAMCEGGNFGQYGDDFGDHSSASNGGGYWRTLWRLFRHDVERGKRFFRLFPGEAMLAPFFRAGGYILRAGK